MQPTVSLSGTETPPSSLMPWQQVWIPVFLEFLTRCSIPSKELAEPGPIAPYEAQYRFLRELDTGLSADQRLYVVLKARQLGLSTIMLILDVFWLYMHPGLQGALVADTDENRMQFRETITQVLENLPRGFRIKVKRHNRGSLILENGSRLQYMVAGKKKNPDLGRSRGLNFLHATELSSWGDQNGINSLLDTLATENPNRLYILESTAKGYNVFWAVHRKAKLDPSQRAIFIGWWAKSLYRIKQGTAEYDYWWGANPVLDKEEQLMELTILQDYGWQMTTEQWAWWRKQAFDRSESNLLQEYPWHEKVAFQVTGSPFFSVKRLTQDIAFVSNAEVTFSGYRYNLTDHFALMSCDEVHTAAESELKIWEKPVRNARYVIGVDVAYGRSPTNDRHVIEIYRCFADKLVQVAEWATSIPETRHVAWVLAHLAGSYRDCMINLEVSGPGLQVMSEMQHLRQQIATAHLRNMEATFESRNALDQARWFLYHRPDTPGQGYLYNWKALALDTPIPTPSGWTTMESLRQGDQVLDENGRPTTVVGVSDIKYGKKCYRLTFDDGSQITADEEHLWLVNRPHWAHQPKAKAAGMEKIRTTAQLRAGKHRIRGARPLDLPEAVLPIDPYVLGAWLGDGDSATGAFTASVGDMPNISAALIEVGAQLGPVRQYNETAQRRTVEGLRGRLVEQGLLNNKHIPASYLRASYAQRLALLQGLMDTDGGPAGNNGQQSGFTTTNMQIAAAFAELLRTLGIKPKSTVRNRTLFYKGQDRICAPATQFWFTPPPGMAVHRLARKAAHNAVERRRRPSHWQRIVEIEEVPSVPVKCIKVDSDSHLYLAGEGMIPTHNTNHDNKQEMFNGLRDSYNTENVVVRSIPLLEEMVTLVQNGTSIAASANNKDDRPFATGLAHYAWTHWVRFPMIQDNRSFVIEMAKQAEMLKNGGNVVQGLIPAWFAQQSAARREAEIQRLINEA